jgi:hypothetical protein
MAICETVKIASEHFAGGFVIINADEFDPSVHQLFVEAAPKPVAPPAYRVRAPKLKEADDGSYNG